jgi:hypothetical protein
MHRLALPRQRTAMQPCLCTRASQRRVKRETWTPPTSVVPARAGPGARSKHGDAPRGTAKLTWRPVLSAPRAARKPRGSRAPRALPPPARRHCPSFLASQMDCAAHAGASPRRVSPLRQEPRGESSQRCVSQASALTAAISTRKSRRHDTRALTCSVAQAAAASSRPAARQRASAPHRCAPNRRREQPRKAAAPPRASAAAALRRCVAALATRRASRRLRSRPAQLRRCGPVRRRPAVRGGSSAGPAISGATTTERGARE